MSNTIKFWVYDNGGPVKIKMRKGQKLRHYSAVDHDEGWSSEACSWEFDGDRVFHEWFTDGRDCDGRMQTFGESFFFANKARAGYVDTRSLDPDGDFIHYPAWTDLANGQRDFSAEAAGY